MRGSKMGHSGTAVAAILLLGTASCGGSDGGDSTSPTNATSPVTVPVSTPPQAITPSVPISFSATSTSGGVVVDAYAIATFQNPWAMNFLPDGRMLVTEAFNGLRVVTQDGIVSQAVTGLPSDLNVPFDVLPSRTFSKDHKIYLSFAQMGPNGVRIADGGDGFGDGGERLSVLTATLNIPVEGGPSLTDVKVIWQQQPPLNQTGEFGGKLTFSPDGQHLFVTAGDRSIYDGGAQTTNNTLGKVLRLTLDGSAASNNPFDGQANYAAEIWTLGHRNQYGLVFDSADTLWESENGPKSRIRN